MADLNLCVFIGRLGKDPEVKYTSGGDAVVNISLAVGKKWKDKHSQETKEQTTWVPINFWGKPAELIGEYARKGSQMRVNGEFSVRKYTDKDGNERYATEIKGQDFQLLGSRQDNEGGQDGGQQQRRAPAPAPAQRQAPARAPAPARQQGGFDDMGDDIPF